MPYRVENIVRKGEIAGYKQFLLLSQCFLQLYILSASKCVVIVKRMLFGGILESDCLSVCLSMYQSVYVCQCALLCTKWLFLSKCWQGFKSHLVTALVILMMACGNAVTALQ